MGLFGNKKLSQEERTEESIQYAERLVSGKGIGGKMTRGIMGKEFTGSMAAGLQAGREGQAYAAAHAAAAATPGQFGVRATVTALADTGKLVDFDPVVALSVTLAGGQSVVMESLVSKLQIPRVGDSINLIPNPVQPDSYAYGGLEL